LAPGIPLGSWRYWSGTVSDSGGSGNSGGGAAGAGGAAGGGPPGDAARKASPNANPSANPNANAHADFAGDPVTRPTADFVPAHLRGSAPHDAAGPRAAGGDRSNDAGAGGAGVPTVAGARPLTRGGASIPKRLGAVVLQRQVGEGGMGVVWLGRHELLNRDVAVKFLLNIVADERDSGFAAFVEGARAAAALRHPGLNAVLHADVADSVPYLVMEYVEGPTLSRVVRVTGVLSVAASRAVLDAVCGAVGELHDHGVIHRDIKPSNILFTGDGTPVVTDFGLACERSVTLMGSSVACVAGTPEYMAPEMFEQTVSPRSDVYALGVMLLELMAGRTPFRGTLEEIQRAHAGDALPPELLAKVPEAVAHVIERATNKNAMFRYKTARHLQRALDEAFSTLDPMQASVTQGRAELARLVARTMRASGGRDGGAGGVEPADAGRGEGRGTDGSGGGREAATPGVSTPLTPGTPLTPSTPGGTYYDRLASLRETKREYRKGSDAGGAAPGAADLVARVDRECACIRCGTSLLGEAITGRCRECLLLVRLSLEARGGEAMGGAGGAGGGVGGAGGVAGSGRVVGSGGVELGAGGVAGAAGQGSGGGWGSGAVDARATPRPVVVGTGSGPMAKSAGGSGAMGAGGVDGRGSAGDVRAGGVAGVSAASGAASGAANGAASGAAPGAANVAGDTPRKKPGGFGALIVETAREIREFWRQFFAR
jgi:hypothetical protein